MKTKIACLCFCIAVLASSCCQTYRSCFDWCPRCGVPCRSVTEIESMIVETNNGPDIFLGNPRTTPARWVEMVSHCTKTSNRKVWISESQDNEGIRISGHYVYLQTNPERTL